MSLAESQKVDSTKNWTQKKNKKIFKKLLDKSLFMWYYIGVKRKTNHFTTTKYKKKRSRTL